MGGAGSFSIRNLATNNIHLSICQIICPNLTKPNVEKGKKKGLRLRLNFIQGTEEEGKEEGLRLGLKFIPYSALGSNTGHILPSAKKTKKKKFKKDDRIRRLLLDNKTTIKQRIFYSQFILSNTD